MENLALLVNRLCQLPNETQWLEFKHDNYTPEMIGEDISALANSATLHEKECAYMIWGIDDATHTIIGTTHNLQSLKVGNQELENWLRGLLSSNADFSFHTTSVDGKTVASARSSLPCHFQKNGLYPHRQLYKKAQRPSIVTGTALGQVA